MNSSAYDMYMKIALDLAREAAVHGEVPVGALVVDKDGQIIGTGANRRETDQDPIAHAEILAIAAAANRTGFWRLEDTTLFVTLEPCPMCAGAILNARIPRVIFGATDPKAGAVRSLYQLLEDDRFNHRCDVTGGIQADECSKVLSLFFQSLRKQGKK